MRVLGPIIKAYLYLTGAEGFLRELRVWELVQDWHAADNKAGRGEESASSAHQPRGFEPVHSAVCPPHASPCD